MGEFCIPFMICDVFLIVRTCLAMFLPRKRELGALPLVHPCGRVGIFMFPKTLQASQIKVSKKAKIKNRYNEVTHHMRK